MKTRLTLNGSPPRVEGHGRALVITLTDTTGSTVEIETDMSVGYQLEQGIREIIDEYGAAQPNLHPVFQGILKRFGQA